MPDSAITEWDGANSGKASRSSRYEDKMFLVRWATSAHSLLRFAPKNAMAKINTGIAINNPRIGIMVKLISVRAMPRNSKNRPTAKSENLSK
jgi:hypothetical protein